MRFYVTRKNLFWISLTLLAALVLLLAFGCTKREEKAAKEAAGTAATLFGLPRPVGEGLAGLVIMAISHFAGHRHGRRTERKCQVRATQATKAGVS